MSIASAAPRTINPARVKAWSALELPVAANTPNVAALSVISGTIRLKNVKMAPPTVLSVRCIIATALAHKIN